MTKREKFLCALCAIMSISAASWSCDTGTVRDAAFHGRRDNFRLGLILPDSDAAQEATYAPLSAWFAEHGGALNVHFEIIDADDVMKLRLEYGLEQLPESLPATALAAYHPAIQRPALFKLWPSALDLKLLEKLRDNPTLQTIVREAPEHWAVLLYARGAGVDRRPEAAAIVAKWRTERPPGVYLLEVNRRAPENAWLCAVVGIEADGEDWAGVVYGRGKLMLPVLTGDTLARAQLDDMLNRLAAPCTCLQQASASGLDLPMFWPEEQTPAFTALAAPAGYHEMTLDDKVASLLEEVPEESNRIRIAALAAVAAAGGLALLIIGLTWLRLRTSR